MSCVSPIASDAGSITYKDSCNQNLQFTLIWTQGPTIIYRIIANDTRVVRKRSDFGVTLVKEESAKTGTGAAAEVEYELKDYGGGQKALILINPNQFPIFAYGTITTTDPGGKRTVFEFQYLLRPSSRSFPVYPIDPGKPRLSLLSLQNKIRAGEKRVGKNGKNGSEKRVGKTGQPELSDFSGKTGDARNVSSGFQQFVSVLSSYCSI